MTNTDDFTSWPNPPEDYTCEFQWNHHNWKKIGQEQYLYARQAREEIEDSVCVWSCINEKCRVPKLLDRDNFIKYCYYYMRRHDLQCDIPDEYIPLDYEKNDELKREWQNRKVKERFEKQYCAMSVIEKAVEEMHSQNVPGYQMKKEPDLQSRENQEYILAVKSNKPDAIRALFSKEGTSKICPNCLEMFGEELNMRRGVVYYAIENLYDETKSRTDALEVLRLVCSLDGVDVNADTWYISFNDGPPLWTAIENMDAEAVKILLHSEARVMYPDVEGLNGQWCSVIKPFEYREESFYYSALHVAVGNAYSDKELNQVLQVLLNERGDELLIKAESALSLFMTILDKEDRQLEFPLSIALLERARMMVNDEGYKELFTAEELNCIKWATIADMDSNIHKSISQYIGISDWVSIKQTCKNMRSFPKPPCPSIDYHLIRFCFSDLNTEEYSGFAKTIPALIDACEFIRSNFDFYYISYQFIRIDDIKEQKIIPLVQYPQTEHRDHICFESYIHHGGMKHFGVKPVDKDISKGSALYKLLTMDYEEVRPCEKNNRNWYNGFEFDSDKMIGAFVWFQDMKPSADINLRHLWHTEAAAEDRMEDNYQIWLNPDKSDESHFDFDEDATWAVSSFQCDLYSY